MNNYYPGSPARLRDLTGLGPRSEQLLAEVGIRSVDEFFAADPYALYATLHTRKDVSLNFLYAIIGARENRSWQEIAKSRRTEILLRLDDLGLAPK